jgi:hypothetical protein
VNTDAAVFGDGIKIILQQNILRRDIGKDEVNLGLITASPAAHNSTNNLQHRRDTSPASDHAEVADHVGRVHKSTLGPAETDRLPDGQRGDVLRDVALRVGLDEEVEVAGLVVAGDRSVGSYDLLGGPVGLWAGSADGDVLADGEAEDGIWRGELEAVAGR